MGYQTMISLEMMGSKAPPQGSAEWFALRRKRMTGSKPASIMFEVKDLQSWTRVHNEMFGDGKPEPFSEEAIARMQYGSDTEDVAAMLIQQHMKGSLFFECPLVPHPCLNWIAASPDGYMVVFDTDENGQIRPELKVNMRYNIEIKCPLYEFLDDPIEMKKRMKKKKHPPYYYMPQIMFEMTMSRVRTTLFIMYSPPLTHVWRIQYSLLLWKQTLDVLKSFKDRTCTWPNMEKKIKDWVNECRRFAQKHKVWKVIEP